MIAFRFFGDTAYSADWYSAWKHGFVQRRMKAFLAFDEFRRFHAQVGQVRLLHENLFIHDFQPGGVVLELLWG